jgi:hypothetical protein
MIDLIALKALTWSGVLIYIGPRDAQMTFVFIILYFSILLFALFFKSREIKSPWLFYLRAFFPNWKFFHAIGYAPRLYVQIKSEEDQWLEWQVIYPRIKRNPFHVFHNPEVNLHLANQNLVEHFVNDLNQLAKGSDARQLVTYALIDRLVRAFAEREAPNWMAYRFEVRMEMPRLNHPFEPEDVQVMLISPEVRHE